MPESKFIENREDEGTCAEEITEYKIEDYIELGARLGEAMFYFTKMQRSVEQIDNVSDSGIKNERFAELCKLAFKDFSKHQGNAEGPRNAVHKNPSVALLHKRCVSSTIRTSTSNSFYRPTNILLKNQAHQARIPPPPPPPDPVPTIPEKEFIRVTLHAVIPTRISSQNSRNQPTRLSTKTAMKVLTKTYWLRSSSSL